MITVKSSPVFKEPDVELEAHEAEMLARVKSKCGLIDAIRVLRFGHKNISLKTAKEFCELL